MESRHFKIHAGEGVKVRKLNFSTWFLLGVLLTMLVPGPVRSEDGNGYEVAKPDFFLPKLQAKLSADGLVLNDAVPPLLLMADPNPQMQGQRTLGRTADDALAIPESAISTFSITYLAAGEQDPWLTVCGTFPDNAKAAFQAAAAIWQNKVRSSVPITISACWANLDSSSILGYSGGQPSIRNFSGAPKANVWYQQSLANALTGVKLTSNFDMHITYNSGFAWYFGTDGNTPYGQYDLVTVAAHEIAHGLNFSGTAQLSGGLGSYGYSGFPSIYDTFMQSATGNPLTSYANSSSALGTLLTSGSLWFNGANANAANGGSRVRIYAPSSWSGGSSYSHLDYASYASTANRMMVYAISSASAMHDPGPVTLALMKDLGWSTDAGFSMSGTVRQGSGTGPVLAGATVTIAGKSAVTSSLGTFSITGLTAGSHTLTVSKAGFVTKTTTGYLIAGNQSGLNWFLLPVPVYSMSGTVRSGSATGPVLAGASVSIAGRTAVTGSTGAFSITAIPFGSYALTISKSGYLTRIVTGYAVKGNQSGLVLYLVPCYTMSGTVRSGSATGPVLAGASLSIAGRTAVTGSTGTFSLAAIPVGSYTLTISKSGYLTRTVAGYAVNGNQSGLNFYLSLAPSYTMSGMVRSGSPTGPALAGATVSIAAKTALTSSTGTFAISGIAHGSYTLTISKSGFATKTVAGYPVNANQGSLVFYLAPAPSYGTIKVVNGSGTFGIAQLYISPSSSPEWGANQISSAIPPGYALNVTQVPPDNYDLLAVFSSGSSYTTWQFPVVAGMTTTIAALPGASGAVQLLKSSEVGQGGGAQTPLRPEGGGRPKR